MATAPKPSKNIVKVDPAVDPHSGLVTVTVYDGTRQPIDPATQILLTIVDGAQNTLHRDFFSNSAITLSLPFHDNFSDNYSVIVSADSFVQAGFQPVKIGPNSPQILDLMLLPKNGGFNFAHAKWADVLVKKPLVAKIFAASVDGDPAAVYADLEDKSDQLACLLNITTAMQQINLPQLTPLDYFKAFDLPNLKPDRIFGYADAQLVAQVKQAAQQGEFDVEPALDLALHPGSTSSFKQKQFGEANVQLTFHEGNRRTIGGVDCVYVEPDIDYFKDPGAHLVLEVLPNLVTGAVSDPRVVYVLRWIAGQHAGIANFDPLYTIQ